ncbi:MAG: envelope stress response membrane protein PspB [Pseudomonadales bacterium]|nr:envelope stress response membrane protein PspB [Pseudomonadales bacterium]
MDSLVVAFFVPALVFVGLVLPIWVIMHYKSKQNAQSVLSDDERHDLAGLISQAEQMADRIDILEAILDSETPGWRDRMRAENHATTPSQQ